MSNAERLHDIVRDEIRYREAHLNPIDAADATVYWFVVASVAAFLVAGVLVYRDAIADRAASMRPISVAQTSSSLEQPPLHTHVEGIDP
jgi:hypothetical protein